jgi:hypothetical protein
MKSQLLRRQTRLKICENKMKELQAELDILRKRRKTSRQLLNKIKKFKSDSMREKKTQQKSTVTSGELGTTTTCAQDLVSLLKKSGHMFVKNDQGQNEFSPCNGVLARALHSDAGVAWNKMPLVFGLVMTSFAGAIDEDSFKYLIKNAGMYISNSFLFILSGIYICCFV